MSDTIQPINTQMAERENFSLVPEKRLSCEQKTVTPSSCGESLLMIQDNPELTAPPSETKVNTDQANSYDKRIKLLSAYGLIAGVIPTSTRKRLGQRTLDFALLQPDGGDAEKQKAD